MPSNTVTMMELAAHFGMKTLVGSIKAISRTIAAPETDRPGPEIMGFWTDHEPQRISLIGNKEMSLISMIEPDELYKNFEKLCDPACPGIVICQGLECPKALFEAATKKDCAVFSTKSGTSHIQYDILDYLSNRLAPHTTLHACFLELYGMGTLLIGDSGIGKSEISLDLIKRGHRLVADDMVEISLIKGTLVGKCPDVLKGMMEVRGIGVIDVGRMFGINATKASANIDYAINLVPFDKSKPMERLGMRNNHIEILGVKRPMVELPVSAARSMAQIIEAAVTNFKLKDYGYDSSYEFQRRFMEINRRNSGGR